MTDDQGFSIDDFEFKPQHENNARTFQALIEKDKGILDDFPDAILEIDCVDPGLFLSFLSSIVLQVESALSPFDEDHKTSQILNNNVHEIEIKSLEQTELLVLANIVLPEETSSEIPAKVILVMEEWVMQLHNRIRELNGVAQISYLFGLDENSNPNWEKHPFFHDDRQSCIIQFDCTFK